MILSKRHVLPCVTQKTEMCTTPEIILADANVCIELIHSVLLVC